MSECCPASAFIERSLFFWQEPATQPGPVAWHGVLYHASSSPGVAFLHRLRLDIISHEVLFFMLFRLQNSPEDPYNGESFSYPTPNNPVRSPSTYHPQGVVLSGLTSGAAEVNSFFSDLSFRFSARDYLVILWGFPDSRIWKENPTPVAFSLTFEQRNH
jgi:hypothetical protein